ncbi:hypothetical protein VP1G_08418 [Cytospora mali]|uniref:Uncharacterized protein n=1 Tax=Cytospora mali TaxID=578113 RepID=A0A194VB37_CYTMA|nr:hypothetical protein VP1G_08418 [Valsa mali var. pyri (nom. inval.)]
MAPPETRAAAAAKAPPAGPLPGAVRAVPCLGCALSALAGRSDGECRDVEGGGRTGRVKRCLRYRFLRDTLRKALAPPGEGAPSEGSLASSPAASERGEEEEEEGVASRSSLLRLRRVAHAAVDAFFDAL